MKIKKHNARSKTVRKTVRNFEEQDQIVATVLMGEVLLTIMVQL